MHEARTVEISEISSALDGWTRMDIETFQRPGIRCLSSPVRDLRLSAQVLPNAFRHIPYDQTN